jgi:hypothetical protein
MVQPATLSIFLPLEKNSQFVSSGEKGYRFDFQKACDDTCFLCKIDLKIYPTVKCNALIINILQKASFVLLWSSLALTAAGQGEVSFRASSDARQAVLNGVFEVTFTLKNGTGSQFTPPSFKDFIIVAGPSTSTSMQIVNGKVSQEMGFSYSLQPTKLGRLVIGSASIKANGKLLRSDPIEVEVVKGATTSGAGNSAEQVFVRIEPSKKVAYVGEQVLLDFKLYTRVGIEGYDIPQDPDYDGFYATELRRFNSNTMQEVVKGQQYATKILRRIALFPQKTGRLSIAPFSIQLGVVDDDGRSNFFFGRNIKPVFVTTNDVGINVLPLPAGADASFCGAVGNFELQAGTDRKSATTDDVVTIYLTLTGNGDVKRIQPPVLALTDSFEVYPPKLTSDKSDELQGQIISERRYEYLILPKHAGEFNIPPELSYFNTATNSYESFSVPNLNLSIQEGTGKKNHRTNSTIDPGLGDILPIKPETELSPYAGKFVGTWLFYLLFGIPVLALSFIFRYKKIKYQQGQIDPLVHKSKLANREAQKRLLAARSQLQTGNSKLFYDEVAKAYSGYVCDRTGLPLSEFTKENAREKLRLLKVGEKNIDEFVKVLQHCEIALFAGMGNQASMQLTYDNAVDIIGNIEADLNQKAI